MQITALSSKEECLQYITYDMGTQSRKASHLDAKA
jgi:hypothetical protein